MHNHLLFLKTLKTEFLYLSINGPMHFNYTCDISKWKSGNYVIHISDGITIVKRIITIN